MERKLLLLGLLRQHEMYGYQINDLIDAHLGSNITLTKQRVSTPGSFAHVTPNLLSKKSYRNSAVSIRALKDVERTQRVMEKNAGMKMKK